MKVLLINGGPHLKGCTYTALAEVAKALEANGIETEIFHIGAKSYGGCMACGSCAKTGKCVLDDGVNKAAELLRSADGVVFGSPVHYAAASGSMMGFLHRLSISAGSSLQYKPAACVVSARRGGTTAALEQLNKVPQYFNMPLVSSNYWPMVHGSCAEDVAKDEEGLQIMRNLGNNMAWVLKCIQAGKEAGIDHPTPETAARTNFIR